MKKLVYLIIILSLSFYCAPKQDEVERTLEDGADVVINHLKPYKIKGQPSSFSLEEELVIDFSSDKIGNLGIAGAVGFEVASDGTIYFMYSDKSDDLIFQFNEKGHFQTSFGRKGQGPGDIQFIRVSGIDANDNLVISDHGNKKMITFSKNGKLVNEEHYPRKVNTIFPLDNGKYIGEWRKIAHPDTDFYWRGISLYDSAFNEMKVLDRYKMPSPIKKGYRGVNINEFFTWKISNGYIYIGNEDRGYEILKYDLDGNLRRKIRKEYIPLKVSADLIKERKGSVERRGLKQWFPEFYLPICDFFPDDEGRLYIMTFEKGENEREFWYDVFNPEGVFINRKKFKIYTWGEIAASAQVKRNRLYCFEEEDDGFRVFKVYKMIWE
jgi:hypothetical protein